MASQSQQVILLFKKNFGVGDTPNDALFNLLLRLGRSDLGTFEALGVEVLPPLV